MSVKQKHGLGRGLDALLAVPGETAAPAEVDLLSIDPNPDQPRKQFDEDKLEELAASIREHGVLQPLLVIRNGERYTLVAGERRWRAARMAGLKQVPALVRDFSAQQVAEVSLVENLQRDDLNPLEEARGIRSLIDTFTLTQEQVAERLSMSRPAVTNALRLLALPQPVLDLMRQGVLSAGHGRALAGVEDASIACSLALRAVDQDLSVRALETLVKLDKKVKEPPQHKKPKASLELKEFEERLMRRLGTKVKITGSPERGSIVLEYYSRSDLERLYERTMETLGSKDER